MKQNKIRKIDEGNNIEKTKKFHGKMQKKLVVLFLFVLLAFTILSYRLYWLITEKGEQYNKQVLSQQRYDSTTLPFRRGDIVDSRGNILATSEKVYNLVIDSYIILSKEQYFEPTMKALGENFDLDMSAIREYVTSHPNSSYYVPIKRMTYDEIAGFNAAVETDSNIKGIWFEEEYRRYYPNGTLASDVIGFTTSDNSGLYGLEEFYDEELNGTTGREFGYLSEDSTLKRTVKSAEDGYTIHSTIDVNIQSIIEKHLLKFNDTYKNNAREGNGANNVGCIIMEVNTGEIIGMASYPNFDLNNTRDSSALIGNTLVNEVGNPTGEYITEEVLETLEGELLLQNFNALWRNYCISDTYEPGSTGKPFTVATGLETGIITGNEVYQCNGYLEIGGHRINCHTRTGDGPVTVQDSIAWSCNVALMEMGNAIGVDVFTKYQQLFNFGLRTNIDLAGEARTASLLYSAEDMGVADLATNTFGQNYNITMIQMIAGFSALINGGYYYEPHMVSKITNSSGATIENIEPRVLKQVVSESTSELMRQYCRATVMEEGGSRRTGRYARPAGYAIGGKTGTAQTLPRGNGEYVVSFVGYAPADDPQIAIYVVIDRPNVTKQDEARLATVLTKDILTEVLPYLNIFMTEELSEKEIEELKALELEITNSYIKTPEDEDVEGTEGTEDTEGTENSNLQEEDSGGNATEPAWMSFPIDPATGYRIDPETKEMLDPDTGSPVNTSLPAISGE